YKSTFLNPAASAVLSVFSTICACSRAAPFSPSRGTRRVLTRPGSGARANTMSAVSGLVDVAPRKVVRSSTEEECEAQAPHEKHRAQHPLLVPPSSRGGRLR